MVAARVEQLYSSHAVLVRSICCSLLRDRLEAEDAVQQTFLSVQRAIGNGSVPRDAAAWLATIARHESLARVRARMREPLPTEIEEGGAAPDAHTVAVGRHEVAALRDALTQLPVQQREAILLREVRGLSYQEVAASLSVTTSAVESLLFRARRSLQTRLQETLAAVAPVGWTQPLRKLAARVAGDGLVAPAAAKVAVAGVGTAIVLGTAVVTPPTLGLGHAPRFAHHTQQGHARRPVDPAPAKRPATLWSEASPSVRVVSVTHSKPAEHAAGGSGNQREVTAKSGSDDTQARARSDANDTSRPESNSEPDDREAKQPAHSSGDDSQPSSGDDSQPISGDDSQTSSGDDSQPTSGGDASPDSGSGTSSGSSSSDG
jgi:RNA polymerase sigma-70 factor, ECF subfamily